MTRRSAILAVAAGLMVAAGADAHDARPRAGAAVKAATPMIHAPASARVGATVQISTSGLVRGRYGLRLIADRHPARGAFCLAELATAPRHSTEPRFTVRIPARLRCYQGASRPLGRTPTTSGAYHFVVAVPAGPATTDGRYSLVRAAVRISA